MIYHEQSEDYRPLFWVNGRPIYAHMLLILGHILAFVVAAFCISVWYDAVPDSLGLDTYRVVHYGEVWRLATYIIFMPSVWFIFAMGFLYFAGKEVEQFVGRKTFLLLYAALVFIPAIVLTLLGLVWPMQASLGGTESIFGVFVAMATIYPGMALSIWFVNLTVKEWAWVLFLVYTLMDLAYHNWASLIVLWTCAAVGYVGMRLVGAGRGMTWLTDWIEERRAQRLARARNFKIVKEKEATESIDAILEKISKQGVGSLSARERVALEDARAKLLLRDKR